MSYGSPMHCPTCGRSGNREDYCRVGEPCPDEECGGIVESMQTANDVAYDIIDIFRAWTGPNGYDINIMSAIASLLVEGGWVDEDDWIVSGEVAP